MAAFPALAEFYGLLSQARGIVSNSAPSLSSRVVNCVKYKRRVIIAIIMVGENVYRPVRPPDQLIARGSASACRQYFPRSRKGASRAQTQPIAAMPMRTKTLLSCGGRGVGKPSRFARVLIRGPPTSAYTAAHTQGHLIAPSRFNHRVEPS